MPPFDLQPFLQFGVLGLVLYWFMNSASSRLTSLEEAIDRSTKASMIFLLHVNGLSSLQKEQVEGILSEIRRAEDRR